MKVPIYFSLHLFLLLCIPVNSHENITDEDILEIYRNMHVQKKLCGPDLANTMRELCVQYNGLRARRSIIQCCKTSCSYYYLMKYFCKVPRVQIDEFPSSLVPTTEPITESDTKVVEPSSDHVSHSAESDDYRQGPIPNKIYKQPTSEELNHRPAEYGYIRSTRPPIIYGHSNTIARGVMTYEIPKQNNNSQQ